MRRLSLLAALACAVALASPAARAHKASDAYLDLRVKGAAIDGRWDIALSDLDDALGIDDDGDGAITWGELRAHSAQISAWALPRLRVRAQGAECTARQTGLQVDRHSDGAYAVLQFALACPKDAAAPGALEVSYSLLWDLDPSHRGLLHATFADGSERTAVFGPDSATQRIGAAGREGAQAAWVRAGMVSFFGYQHLLFLVALLLPAVLRRAPPREALRVASMFALAHSITLALATLGLLAPPARFIAAAVALSIALAALANLAPVLRGKQWLLAFGFGLVHGFDFARALFTQGFPKADRMQALLGFNAGLELGQLALLLACAGFAVLASAQPAAVKKARARSLFG